jgi:hypothetical protein
MENQNKVNIQIPGPGRDILEVKYADFHSQICDNVYRIKKDPENQEEKVKEFFRELICSDIESRRLSSLYHPFEMSARYLDNVMPVMMIADDMRAEREYKQRDIKSPIQIAYLNNLDILFHSYTESLDSALEAIQKTERFHPWNSYSHINKFTSRAYDSLEGLAYYPPIVKTLEGMTPLGKEAKEICEEFDNKRFNIVAKANLHLKGDPNDGM